MDKDKSGHTIRLGIRREDPWIQIEVEDNGLGMDQETREKIFSLFFSSKGPSGTGLGLFVSNRIAEAHGGSVSARNLPEDAGVEFTIHLPAA